MHDHGRLCRGMLPGQTWDPKGRPRAREHLFEEETPETPVPNRGESAGMVRKFTCRRASLHASRTRNIVTETLTERSPSIMPEPQVPKGNGTNSFSTVINSISINKLVIIGAGGFGAVAASVADDINAAATERDRAAPWDLIGYADLDT